MGKIAEAREELIAASRELRRYLEDREGRDLKADEQREADQLSERFEVAEARYKRLSTAPLSDEDSPADVAAKRHATGGFGLDMDGKALPFPGGNGHSAPGAGSRPTLHKQSWGDAVIKSLTRDGYSTKDLLTPSGMAPVTIPLAAEPVTDQRRVTFLRQLVDSQSAPSGRFSYLKQTTRTNNAAVVAAGDRKPVSIYTLERIDDSTDTIAHLSEPINRADLSDASLLRSFLDGELRYGLDLALDAEILDAILNEASAATPGGTSLESARKAITALQQAEFEPTGFVMSPQDWETVELEAAEQFAANPSLAPTNAMTRRLYGVPVVVSNGMADGTALLGDFRSGATLYVTEEGRVDWSENIYRADLGDGNPGTDFERNMIVFRAEMRAKTAVLRPPAFVTIAFGS